MKIRSNLLTLLALTGTSLIATAATPTQFEVTILGTASVATGQFNTSVSPINNTELAKEIYSTDTNDYKQVTLIYDTADHTVKFIAKKATATAPATVPATQPVFVVQADITQADAHTRTARFEGALNASSTTAAALNTSLQGVLIGKGRVTTGSINPPIPPAVIFAGGSFSGSSAAPSHSGPNDTIVKFSFTITAPFKQKP